MQGKKKKVATNMNVASSHQHECCFSWSSEDESLTANTELTTFDKYYTAKGKESQTILGGTQ